MWWVFFSGSGRDSTLYNVTRRKSCVRGLHACRYLYSTSSRAFWSSYTTVYKMVIAATIANARPQCDGLVISRTFDYPFSQRELASDRKMQERADLSALFLTLTHRANVCTIRYTLLKEPIICAHQVYKHVPTPSTGSHATKKAMPAT